MKKLFFACAIAISALAMATAGNASVDTGISSTYLDTVPKPTDTTKKPIPDSISQFMVIKNK